VLDPENPYRYLSVRGRATLTEEGAAEHVDTLARQYLGVDRYPHHDEEPEPRVIIWIPPSTSSWGAKATAGNGGGAFGPAGVIRFTDAFAGDRLQPGPASTFILVVSDPRAWPPVRTSCLSVPTSSDPTGCR